VELSLRKEPNILQEISSDSISSAVELTERVSPLKYGCSKQRQQMVSHGHSVLPTDIDQ
jgi:hypothetical protein